MSRLDENHRPAIDPAARPEPMVGVPVDALPDGVLAFDRACRYTAWNSAMERLTALSATDVVGRHAFELFPFLVETGEDRCFGEALAGRTAVSVEQPFTVPETGHKGFYEGHYAPVCDDAGEVTGGIAIIRDVTMRVRERREAAAARERAESALLQAESAAEAARAQATALVESLGDAFVAYDRDFRFTFVNRRAEEIFGALGHAGSLLGRTLWDAFPRLAGSPMERAMRRTMQERVPLTLDTEDDDRKRWYTVRLYPSPDGGLSALWADVTAARRAEETNRLLAQVSDVLVDSLDVDRTLAGVAQLVARSLADYCTVHLLETDGDLRCVDVAHADPARAESARRIEAEYPLPHDALVGAPFAVRTGRSSLQRELPAARIEAAARDAEHLRLLRSIGMRSTIVVPLIARGRTLGALSLVQAESGRTFDEAGLATAEELARRAALAVDNARLYREAADARVRADEANRAKSDFLAVMSHELRTPLNAITGYVDLLELGIYGPLADRQHEALGRVQQSTRHLLAVINEVLNYARLEAGGVRYELADVPVREVLGGVEALVAPQVREKGLTLTVEEVEVGLVTRADPEKLRQVLVNLLSNAIKFTGGSGRIALSARRRYEHVVFAVADTGCGIAAEKLEAIFEPFVQVDARLTREQSGTGLGLSISRDLARGMGGDLTVASAPGVGSTFELALPVA